MSKDSGLPSTRVAQPVCALTTRVWRVALLASLLPLAACKPETAPATQNAAPAASLAPATPPAQAVPAPAVLSTLKAGMSHDELQATLVADGWLPLEDRQACVASLGDAMANACRNLPELHSCDAGKSTCQIQLAKPGQPQALNLELSDTQSPGAVQLGTLVAFNAVPLPDAVAAAAPAACPATDFNAFLQAFAAASPAQRAAWSAPLLQVTRVVEDEESDESPRQVLVPQARYSGFALGYADGKFQLVDSAGTNQGPIEPVIATQGSDAMQVSFPENVEAIHYLFRKDASCWRFIGSPEQTAP
ncbi:hypothetical protein [Pseudoxanthomonas sp. GM95]|uniref:hypothetical protein n=1 Tax=Pseudoxanthomonas sp. GM95 TaxID=1881043 RepID=UPI001113E97F|nr:hypothetical protein [Pseudoxanthomonas sp. GM95]